MRPKILSWSAAGVVESMAPETPLSKPVRPDNGAQGLGRLTQHDEASLKLILTQPKNALIK